MKELVNNGGGRLLYQRDFDIMQNLSLSVSQIFSGSQPFVISGCEITGATGNKTIASGFIWMDGKIREFSGATGVDLSGSNFLVQSDTTEQTEYNNSAFKVGINDFTVVHQTSTPASGLSFIVIPSNGVLPNIDDRFFGSRCILSDTTASRQSINQTLDVNNNLNVAGNVSVDNGTGASSINLRRTISGVVSRVEHTISSSGVGSISHYSGTSRLGQFRFDPNERELVINIAGQDRITINDTFVAVNSLTWSNNLTNNNLLLSNNNISAISNDAIEINKVSTLSGTQQYRNLIIYNGQGFKVSEFIGSDMSLRHYGQLRQESTIPNFFSIRDTVKDRDDLSFQKYMSISDRNSVDMMKFGFLGTANNSLTVQNLLGDVVISATNKVVTTRPIMEVDQLLSDKYANKQSTEASLNSKVDAVHGKELSSNDFTDSLKTKLEGINEALSISSGGDGYVTSDLANEALSDRLSVFSNLSDLGNVVQARNNLDVYSRSEAQSRFLDSFLNLSDLPNASIARGNLNVPSNSDVYDRSQLYTRTQLYTRDESNSRYEPSVSDTGWVDALSGSGIAGQSVRCRQIGKVVNISGELGFGSIVTDQIIFTIPNSIGVPANNIATTMLINNNPDIVNNLKCLAGERVFRISEVSMSLTLASRTFINITYFTN